MEPRWDADLGRYEWGPPASPEPAPTIEPAFIREAVVSGFDPSEFMLIAVAIVLVAIEQIRHGGS